MRTMQQLKGFPWDCRAPEVAAFVTIALTCLFCTAEASRAGGFLFSAPWRSASGRGLENRKLQQAEPALDVLTPQCFWAGADCRADVDALFPDFSLYYDVVSHRANASVCLSWSAEIVGNCRNGASRNITHYTSMLGMYHCSLESVHMGVHPCTTSDSCEPQSIARYSLNSIG